MSKEKIREILTTNIGCSRAEQSQLLNAVGLKYKGSDFTPQYVSKFCAEHFPELRKKAEYTKGATKLGTLVEAYKQEVMDWQLPAAFRLSVIKALEEAAAE